MTKKIDIEELKVIVSKEELYDLYVTQNKSKKEILNFYNLTIKGLEYLLKTYNIKKNFEKNQKNIINKEILYDYYIIQNLSIEEIKDIFKISRTAICKNLNNYNIKKSKELKKLCEQRLCLQKTGYTNYFQAYEKQIKQINLEKYGTENVFASNYCKEKIKQTNLERYGVEFYSQTDIFKDKVKNTKKSKYGNKNYNNREKAKQTTIERYDVENYTKTDEYKKRSKQTCLEKYGVDSYKKTNECQEKIIKTCLEKYGVDNPCKCKEIYNKMKSTLFQNYKVINPSQCYEIQQRKYITQHKNNSFNTSKPEDEIVLMLLVRFPDTERQYYSKVYPFHCDFYIPSLDLYIEYQGNWTHGKEPFNINNSKHLAILDTWKVKAKSSKFYESAIDVWTHRDPLKRQTAAANHLNWLEFFTMDQFLTWYNNLS